ncbi:hypothetical protein D0863_10734 [Hortaea werneckii]|uniref:HTH TFE/IIEalpha-type domain-containing protein n=1 Tax=Hortaea werneckii TaxID=91943 RepID=A0A3M7DFV4_HORWE|nr:hypothetical protein D0863_10734 [Hortaea werneckii]
MASTATDLLRTVARAFYPTEHILVIEALIIHSTLSDSDLAHVLNLQPKALRKLCGRLKEDGLVSIQTRSERRTDGTGSFYGGAGTVQGPGKERLTSKDWYYLNFHRAIDAIKWRTHKLNQKIEADSAPTTEKKDLNCPQCKAQWTYMEVMDRVDYSTGLFKCPRCAHLVDEIEEDAKNHANEGVKRLNNQLEGILRLLQMVDGETVPENDFESALAKQKPIVRAGADPGQTRTEVVDLPRHGLQSSKGLEMKPEKLTVSLQSDEDVKRANAEADAQARREKEARQNMLPDWIAKSTVSGDITAVGAKEEKERLMREAHQGGALKEEDEEKKPAAGGGEEEMMAAYWAEMQKAQDEAAKKAAEEEDEEEEEEEDDEFEDVGGISAPATNGHVPTPNGSGAESGNKRPAADDTVASAADGEEGAPRDDERSAKRPRVDQEPSSAPQQNGTVESKAEDTPAEASREASDEDDDELEFENV